MERLATYLRAFIKQVEHDLNFKEEIFGKYDRLEIPAGYYSHLRKISEPFSTCSRGNRKNRGAVFSITP